MLIAALVLVAVGMVIAASAVAPWPFDFAVAVAWGWHVTIFPPPLWVGGLVISSGIAALLARLWLR